MRDAAGQPLNLNCGYRCAAHDAEVGSVPNSQYNANPCTIPAKSKSVGAPTDQEIQNNYYAITQERKHRISAVATVIDSKAYATLAYTNDRMTYEVHSKDLRGVDGGSVLYSVKKW